MKQYYLFTILFLVFQCSFGQIGFEESIVFNNTLNPDGIISEGFEDIDNDGDLDLIIGALYPNEKIVWYENMDGLGNYSIQKIISTEISGLVSVILSDIDADGDIDVLSASAADGKISLYENLDGLGTFGSQQLIAISESVDSISISDINGDSDLDIIASTGITSERRLVWFESLDGQGAFSDEQPIVNNLQSSIFYGAVSSSDLDGDGDMDVFIPETFNDNEFKWYQNTDGLGNFSPVLTNIATNSQDNNNHITISSFTKDFDQDGDMDIVTPITGFWFENNGSGIFSEAQNIISTTGVNSGYQVIALDDIDGDGDLDAVTKKDSVNRLAWHENLGDNQPFLRKGIIENYFYSPGALTADVNTDGDIDVVTITNDNDTIAWHENLDGLGNFGIEQIIEPTADRPSSVFTADFDGDGDLDFVAIFAGDSEIAWFENTDGQGTFSEPISITKNIASGSSVSAADLDGDGDNDIIASGLYPSSIDNKLVWYENLDGLGNFGPEQLILDDGVSTQAIHTADIDNDNDIDILAVSSAFDQVIWFENIDGNGTFGPIQIITNETDGPQSVVTADIDNDGDLDVISASLIDDKLAWYENLDGSGNFGSQQIISVSGDGAISVNASDIDNDGDFDVVLGSNIDDKVAWYENLDGLGAFGTENIIFTNARRVREVKSADMDDDGDMDVLSASIEFTDKVAWFENVDGNGSFGEEQLITTRGISDINGIKQVSINVADVNLDGRIDVLTAFEGDNSLAWYINEGVLRNEIYGTISTDINNNGCASGEVPAYAVMVLTSNGTDDFATFSTQSGVYQFFVEDGDYTTTIASNLLSNYTVSPIELNSSFVGNNNTDEGNFCLIPTTTVNDVNISIYPIFNDPRPGFNIIYQMVYQNVGTTQLSGNVTYEFDDLILEFVTASETVISQTNNLLTFGYENLNPFETRTINLEFNLFPPPTTQIGAELNGIATINPIPGDETEDDNVFILEQTVIGSYDPNDITVLEGEEITIDETDKFLHYLIRFQNTGTASAIDVRVEHILDDKLDWSTMQLESLSHTGRVEITNETDVSFIFNNINLPDSTNDEPNSHGFIAFKIKPKSDVEVGDIISGVADIYFDFNPPIITNTATTEIVEQLSVDEQELENIKLFPNPAKTNLQITSNQIIDELTIIDINGRVLKSIEILVSDYSLDISGLSKGVYFMEIQTGASKSVKKFIKQ